MIVECNFSGPGRLYHITRFIFTNFHAYFRIGKVGIKKCLTGLENIGENI